MKSFFRKAISFILNPRLLLCFGIAWMITNGWSYVMFGFGTYLGIAWMIAVSSAYLTFLWLPISPEKIVTIAIAIFLLKKIFPKDEKTLAVLAGWYDAAKSAIKRKQQQRKERKERKKNKATSEATSKSTNIEK